MTHGQAIAFLIHSKPIAQLSKKIPNTASFYIPLCRLSAGAQQLLGEHASRHELNIGYRPPEGNIMMLLFSYRLPNAFANR